MPKTTVKKHPRVGTKGVRQHSRSTGTPSVPHNRRKGRGLQGMRQKTWDQLITDLEEDGYVMKKFSNTKGYYHFYLHPQTNIPPDESEQVYFFHATGRGCQEILLEEQIVLDEYTPKNYTLLEVMSFGELKKSKDLIDSWL